MHRFFTSTKKTADSGAKEMSGGTGTRQPQKFTSWNCNGFSVRLNKENKQNLNDFIAFLEKEQPDVVTLQEVRMTRAAETRSGVIDPSKRSPKCDRSDADLFADFKRRIPQYSVHLSLAGKKYAGQAIFVHKTLQSPVLSFTFDKSGMKGQHDNEGRIIIAEFDSLVFVSTYTPNNGITEEKFQRRRDWDASSELFLGSQRDSGKVVVYQGDLNVAAEDDDLSGDPAWWRSQCCVDAVDPNDIGQPGSTINEQKRFHHILDVAGLVDSWRALNGPKTAKRGIHAALYTWRGASGPRYYGKGMRIDYHLVSKCLLESGMVDTPDINGYGLDMEGFMGSDHCPVTLTLKNEWWKLLNMTSNKNTEESERSGVSEKHNVAHTEMPHQGVKNTVCERLPPARLDSENPKRQKYNET